MVTVNCSPQTQIYTTKWSASENWISYARNFLKQNKKSSRRNHADDLFAYDLLVRTTDNNKLKITSKINLAYSPNIGSKVQDDRNKQPISFYATHIQNEF